MDKTSSAEEAVKASLLYLYQGFRDDGMSVEDARKEVGFFVVEALKEINALGGFKVIALDSKNINTLNRIKTQTELLVKSPQTATSTIGKNLASCMADLLDN